MPPPPLPVCTWGQILRWVLGRRQRLRVRGDSMLPTLRPGDQVLMRLQRSGAEPLIQGDLVVALHPKQRGVRVVKRLARCAGTDAWILIGDNPSASSDSRSWGPLPAARILGRVVCRFP